MADISIYLSGAMRFTPEEESYDRDWRDRLTALVRKPGVVIFNPMEGQDGTKIFGRFPITTNDSLLQLDVESMRRSDIIFMNLLPLVSGGYPHIGTLAELGVSIALRKMLIIVARHPDVIRHPFIRGSATIVLPTLIDGIAYLRGAIKTLRGESMVEQNGEPKV